MKGVSIMSNIRGGRVLRSRGSDSANRLQTTQPSEGSIIPPLMSSTYDVAPSPVTSNSGASQQSTIIHSKSGVLRYLSIIKN